MHRNDYMFDEFDEMEIPVWMESILILFRHETIRGEPCHDGDDMPGWCVTCEAYRRGEERYYSWYFGASIAHENAHRRVQREMYGAGVDPTWADNEDLLQSGRGHLVRGVA